MSVKFKDLEAAIKFDHFNFVIFLEKEKKPKMFVWHGIYELLSI